jgi:hypothetical protein
MTGKRLGIWAVLAAVAVLSYSYAGGDDLLARGGSGLSHSGSSGGTHHYSSGSSHSTGHYSSHPVRISSHSGHTYHTSHHASGYVGARDAEGRIVRSEEAKREFEKMTGYPHGRPGYVVDHIIALKRGGADSPSNMQWQTIADAKAKDKWE